MKIKYLALPIVALMLGILVLSMTPLTVPVGNSEGLRYDGWVCVYKNNELVQCKHNLITNAGKTLLEGVSQAKVINVTKVAVANSTSAQGAGDTTLAGEWTTCGLAAAPGNFADAGTGAWNVSYQWTVTGAGCSDVIVNATGLHNWTGSNQLFAETTFTTVTLQTNDRLNVTWGLEVS